MNAFPQPALIWRRIYRCTAVLLGCTSLFHASLYAQSPVTISLDTKNPGGAVPPDFSGLSFETSLLLPGPGGIHYFRPDNQPLINLFHTLNIKSLRLGGNTSDRDADKQPKLPGEADLDSLFKFASVAGVKVIYCLRLHNGDPQEDINTAAYIIDHYEPLLECFSIGQEPSAYPKPYAYANYQAEWAKFATAIIAAAPSVKFAGPGVHNNADWARRFMADFGHSNHVVLVTEHLYPGGAGGKVPTPERGRDRMLDDSFAKVCQKLYDGFGPMALSKGLPYRLEEVNNYFNGGATNVSNTYASALWGLDFLCWWAGHCAAGVNFHTGDKVAAGSQLSPSRYTAFYSTASGFEVRPLAYGISAFALANKGRVLPAGVTNPDHLNLTACAMLDDAKNLSVIIINKEHGPTAHAVTITIKPNSTSLAKAQVIFMKSATSDIAATQGVTLGGSPIAPDGTWHGTWTPLAAGPSPGHTGNFWVVKVPAASAAVIRLTAGN